jgi:drug/metabolite transporter (DMT)-like permease
LEQLKDQKTYTSLNAAYIMLFVTAFGWALSTIVIKLFIESVPAFHMMLGRFALAALIFGLMKRKRVRITKKLLFHGSYLGFFLFLAYYLAISSLYYTSAAKSGFLVALSVLGVPLAQLVFRRQRPNKWVLLSVVLSLFGLYWISGLDGLGFNIGDAMALGCSVAYTAYILLIDKYAGEMNEDEMTFIILLIVAVMSLVSVLLFEGFDLAILIDGWLPIVLVCIFGTLMSTYYQTRAQQVASPESVGIILLGEPLFTIIMAIIILGETVTGMGLVGAGLLLVSLLIAVVKHV